MMAYMKRSVARGVVSEMKAEQAHYVLAVIDGICRGVYVPKVVEKGADSSRKAPAVGVRWKEN